MPPQRPQKDEEKPSVPELTHRGALGMWVGRQTTGLQPMLRIGLTRIDVVKLLGSYNARHTQG